MKRALILGGTQFFGKRLVYELLEKGTEVTIATRGRTPDDFGNRVERLIIDRENKDSMIKAFENKKWDVVYDQSCFSPLEAKSSYETLQGKIKHYIFTSTMAVYEFGRGRKEEDFDPLVYKPSYKERKDYKGMSGYQEAKRSAEAYLFQTADVPVASVRPALVIGIDDYTERLFFHVKKVKNEEPIGLVNPGHFYSYTSSEDAAGFLYMAGEKKLAGAFNIAFEKSLSLNDLLHQIESAVGKKAMVTSDITKENASPYGLAGEWTLDVSKAERAGYSFEKLNPYIERLIEEMKKET
ncbi:NAD-dependent epimerase/dehydratase family protein [Metabacillus idriensis]|uniref:NAD-dependent epimerase/dehydratase family protein n=1 Tax=Metabacillus idriensis TaxID=324768 RepID=UPI003D2D119D